MITADPEYIGSSILLIDDDEALRTTIVQMLEFAGFNVVAAHSAALGLKLAAAQPFRLILTDLMMPEMDGYTLIAELKKSPKTAHIPVIVATGKADPLDQRESLQRGATDYLVKPFKIEMLLKVIQRAIRAAESSA